MSINKKLKQLLLLLNKFYDFLTLDEIDKMLMKKEKQLFHNMYKSAEAEEYKRNKKRERKERGYKLDKADINREDIKKCIIMCSKKEDEKFQKDIENNMDILIDEIIRFLYNTEMLFQPRPGVDYKKLILFMATAGRLLAKKQREKSFIFQEENIEFYILLFLKEFDEKTRDFIREFLYDLTDMLGTFIMAEVDED